MSNLAYANSIAELTGRIGYAKARGVIGSANAWIPAVQNIPRSLGDWAEARDARKVQAQNQQIRQLQLETAQREGQRSLADWNDEQQIRALGPLVGNDPEALAREVSTINPTKAAPYRAEVTAQKAALSEAINKFVGGVLALPPEKQPEGWSRFRTSMIGSKMPGADQLPEAFDPNFAQSLFVNTLTSEAQRVEATKPKPTEELVKVDVNGVETWVPRSQAANRPAYREPAKGTDAKPGSLEYELVAEAKAKGVPVEALTAADRARVKARWEAAGRAPEKPAANTEGRITLAQRSAAERWKFEQLQQLEKQFRAGGGSLMTVTSPDGSSINYGGNGNEPMTNADLNAAKLQIENAYRRQIGLQPFAQLPSGWNASSTTSPPPPTTPQTTNLPPTLGANSTQLVQQNGITYRVTTDAAGKVIQAVPAGATSANERQPTLEQPRSSAPPTAPNVAVGSEVAYQGKRYRVKAIVNGQAELEPIP